VARRNRSDGKDERNFSNGDGLYVWLMAARRRKRKSWFEPGEVGAHHYAFGVDFQGDDIWVATSKA
jgi:hypothetical protein